MLETEHRMIKRYFFMRLFFYKEIVDEMFSQRKSR
jgi:hypothetical protein